MSPRLSQRCVPEPPRESSSSAPLVSQPSPSLAGLDRLGWRAGGFGIKCTYNRAVDRELTIVFEPAEEGGFTAYIPEVPGAVSEGETISEARDMVLDALRELTQYRREAALRAKSPRSVVERVVSVS